MVMSKHNDDFTLPAMLIVYGLCLIAVLLWVGC